MNCKTGIPVIAYRERQCGVAYSQNMHDIYNKLIIDKNSGILHLALLVVMHCRRCKSSHLLVGAPVIAYLERHGSIPVVSLHPYGAITLALQEL